MASPIQQALKFLATVRSRRYRAAKLVLLASIVLAQAALIVHRIDHSRAGHGVVCALCVAADHAPAPSHQAALAAPSFAPDKPQASIRALAAAPFIPSYHSRAPPVKPYRT